MTFSNRTIGLSLFGVFVLICLAAWWLFTTEPKKPIEVIPEETPAEPILNEELPPKEKVIGTSVQGRPIVSRTYGSGETNLLFVGGVHGGYEWNSVLLAYDFIDALETGIVVVPDELTITVIPALNPDGLYSVVQKEGRFTSEEIPPNDAHQTGQGRFNANNVDLNRNFACKWQPKSSWRGKTVEAGATAFSEPEAVALRDLVAEKKFKAVVFWHSQANTVYASECESGVLPETMTLMNLYADAAKYKKVSSFDAYPITGDAEGWLASLGIPAITVELETRTSPEWDRNLAGINALLSHYKIVR